MASRTAGAGTTSDSCLEPPSSTAASPDWSRHDRGRKRRPEMSIRRGTPVARRARVIGQKLTEHWRQPTIVETRPGAGTIIGTQAAAKADPDGYTLIIVVSN